MRRSTRTAGLLAAGLAGAVGTALAVPGTASAAAPVERDRYSFDDTFTEQICGITATLSVTGSGLFMARPVKGSDGQAFLGFDRYRVTEVWSTAAGSVRIELSGAFHEKTGTRVPGSVTYSVDLDGDGDLETVTSDDVWQFTAQDAGTFRLYDAEGTRLLSGSGTIKMAVQFDTLGDSQVGGIEVPGTFEVLHEAGPGPTDEQFCAAVVAELT